MTSPESPDDDLQDWMDQLAGRKPANPANSALRKAIVRRQAEEEVEVLAPPNSLEQREQVERLLADVRKLQPASRQGWLDRFLGRAQGVGAPSASVLARPRLWGLAAAGIVVVAVGMRLAMQPQPGAEFRFESGPPPMLRSGDEWPAVAAELEGRPLLYREGGRITVDFDLNPDLRADMQSRLDKLGLNVKLRDGLNRIVLTR